MGADKDQSLSLDREVFDKYFNNLLSRYERIGRAYFFKMVHVAFEKTLGRSAKQELIFYHIHNPDNYELLNYLRHFPDSKLLLAVREPLQSCESWLNNSISKASPYLRGRPETN